jgi:cytochrome c biogenesis protein CcmG/thiol:disulfide interchange protein DsbE
MTTRQGGNTVQRYSTLAWLFTPAPRLAAYLLALTAAGACLAADVGTPAPDIVLQAANGSSQKLSDLHGKVVYLDFWASWCIPCRESFPQMNTLQQRYGDRDLVIVAMNLDAKGTDANAFLARYPAQFRIAFDSGGGSAKLFGVKAMPTSFLIGRDGTLLYEHRGYRESQAVEAELEIQKALARK